MFFKKTYISFKIVSIILNILVFK